MEKNWYTVNRSIIYFLEYNTLPNLLANTIAYIYYHNYRCTNFNHLYNNVKSYINITNEDKKGVMVITKNILKNKFNLKIVSYKPLRIKKVI